MDDLTPGQRRTLRARETRTRNRLDRLATELRKAGWLAVPPEYVIIEPDRVTIKDRALSVGAGRG